MKRLLCKIFGHKFCPSTFEDWKKDRTNFICKKCGKRIKKYEELPDEKIRFKIL